MLLTILGVFLAIIAVATFVLARVYSQIPAKELKRRARKGDEIASLLYQTISYGVGVWVILGIIGLLSLYFSFVSLTVGLDVWLATPILLLVAFFGFFAVQSRGGIHDAAFWLAAKVSPALSWTTERLHPVLDAIGRALRRILPLRVHSGLYEKEDLAKLLEQQKGQPDNRIDSGEIDLLINALGFGDKTVVDALVPKRVVASVSVDDDIGPVLMGELHATGHSRFPVYEGTKEHIIGTLYLHDLVGTKATGKVRDIMSKKVVYVHEKFTLYQTLQAFIKTKKHLFIVVNEFEEYVGIITIEDVLERVIGKLIVDEFDQYDDLRAVAAAAAKKEHAHNHKDGIGAEPTPEAQEVVQ
jgi:CBS domain containing-hemolysin-like protein